MAKGGTFGTTASERARDGAAKDRALGSTPELAELLSGALQRLAGETRAGTAAAWVQANGGPVLVASFGEPSPVTPSEAALDALFAETGATDLGARELDGTLVEYGAKAGFTAGLSAGFATSRSRSGAPSAKPWYKAPEAEIMPRANAPNADEACPPW